MEVLNKSQPQQASRFTIPQAEAKKSVADLVVEHLIGEGIDKVFGIPGGATIPLHVSLERSPGIEFVLTRHEGGAAFMADCYARTSGKIGVCCATTGPGATNLITGVAAAYVDSIPMLVITGMNSIETWGRGDFQESSPYTGVDTTQIFRSICKSSEVIVSEKNLQFRLRNALATALSGRPGPVHLAIPRNLWNKQISPELWERSRYLSHSPAPSNEDIARVLGLLKSAKRPLILYGSGASDAAASKLCEIGEMLHIPVITTPRAKGKRMPRITASLLGSMGISSTPVVDQLFNDNGFDVVLTVGAGFGSYATNSWNNALCPAGTMIQVNIDPCAIGRIYPADIGITADGDKFSESLLREAQAASQDVSLERKNWLAKYSQQEKWPFPAPSTHRSETGPSPLEIIRAVDQVAGEQSIVMADSNSILLWATHHLPERAGRCFVSVWGSASMGHVTAGAVGAKLANPNHDVIAMVGDGCFLMNGNEIATAADLKLPIVWIVNANQQLGMIHYELRSGTETRSATLENYDLAGFARSLGAYGIRYRPGQDLAAIIQEGLRLDGPTVIQVDVDPMLTPPMGMKKEGSRQWQEYINTL